MNSRLFKNLAVQVAFWLIILYLLYLTLTTTFFLFCDHDTVVTWFKECYPDAYFIDQYEKLFFTKYHHNLINKTGWLILLSLTSVTTYLIIKKKNVQRSLYSAGADIGHLAAMVKNSFVLRRDQVAIVTVCFIALLSVKVYLFKALPYHVDEVFSFALFADKGFLHAHIYSYLANHIAYNMASAFWWKMGIPATIALRLTSVLSGILVLILIYGLVKHYFDFKAAILALAFTGLSFWCNVYSIEGRGYMLMSLFVLISTASLLQQLTDGKRGYYLFIASSMVGFYTVRTFLIPFLALLMVWLFVLVARKDYGQLKRIVYATIVIFAGSVFLYLPEFFWSGVESILLTNEAIQYTTGPLVTFFKSPVFLEIISVGTDFNKKGYLILAILFVLPLLLYSKLDVAGKTLFLLHVAFFFSLIIVIAFTHVAPPFRSFVFYNIIFSTAIAILSCKLLVLLFKNKTLVKAGIVILIFLKSVNFVYFLNHGWPRSITAYIQDEKFYNHLDSLSHDVLNLMPTKIFMERQDHYLSFYLKFQAMQNEIPVRFSYSKKDMLKNDVVIVYTELPSSTVEFQLYQYDPLHGFIYYRKRK